MPMTNNTKTLTAANSIVMLRCKGVYDSFIRIQGFQADNAWAFNDATIGETKMGVDGKQSGGYTPHEVPFVLYLEANSSSIDVMENIRKDFNQNMETRLIDFVVELPAIKKRYSGSGYWVNLSGGTSGQKLLAGSQFTFNLVLNGAEDIG